MSTVPTWLVTASAVLGAAAVAAEPAHAQCRHRGSQMSTPQMAFMQTPFGLQSQMAGLSNPFLAQQMLAQAQLNALQQQYLLQAQMLASQQPNAYLPALNGVQPTPPFPTQGLGFQTPNGQTNVQFTNTSRRASRPRGQAQAARPRPTQPPQQTQNDN